MALKVFCCCPLSPDTLIEPELPIPPEVVKTWQLEELRVYTRYPMELIKKNQPRYIRTNYAGGGGVGNGGSHTRIYPNIDIYRCQYCGNITAVESLDPTAE